MLITDKRISTMVEESRFMEDKRMNEQENLVDGYVMADDETVQDSIRITIDMPDGTSKKYEMMGLFVADVFQYMALSPLDPDDTDIVLLPCEEGPDGEAVFRDFYSDEEYETAAAAFDRLFNDDPDEDISVLDPNEIEEESELTDADYEW
jgi:hypothetical protein